MIKHNLVHGGVLQNKLACLFAIFLELDGHQQLDGTNKPNDAATLGLSSIFGYQDQLAFLVEYKYETRTWSSHSHAQSVLPKCCSMMVSLNVLYFLMQFSDSIIGHKKAECTFYFIKKNLCNNLIINSVNRGKQTKICF